MPVFQIDPDAEEPWLMTYEVEMLRRAEAA
jgi:hypothetical protein